MFAQINATTIAPSRMPALPDSARQRWAVNPPKAAAGELAVDIGQLQLVVPNPVANLPRMRQQRHPLARSGEANSPMQWGNLLPNVQGARS